VFTDIRTLTLVLETISIVTNNYFYQFQKCDFKHIHCLLCTITPTVYIQALTSLYSTFLEYKLIKPVAFLNPVQTIKGQHYKQSQHLSNTM
jgi:hypothetical protein